MKLKFPILKNIEYIDVIAGKARTTFSGLEVDGLKWREFQELIGKKLGAGAYHYVLKLHDDNTIYKGGVRAVNVNETVKADHSNIIESRINELDNRINKMGSNTSVEISTLLEITRAGYETRIGFMKDELKNRDDRITRLDIQVKDLENEIDGYLDTIEELKEKTGIGQYINIAKEFLSMKVGNTKPIENLAGSNSDDIPPDIIQVLGVVDWDEVDPTVKDGIIHYLKIFIQKLPMKGLSHA